MSVNAKTLNLDEFPLFREVEPDAVQAFLNMGYTFQYQTGTPLVVSNDLGETFFLILSGMAKLVLTNSRSEEFNITLFRSGDFFGELSMLESQPIARTANVVAITEIEVLVVQKRDFLAMVNRHPRLALNITSVLGQRLRAMNERLLTIRLPEPDKVVQTFIALYHKGKRFSDSDTVLLPPLSLKEWAMFCYTTSESFLEQIEIMRQKGILEWQSQRIAIKDYEGLKLYSEKPLSSITLLDSTVESGESIR